MTPQREAVLPCCDSGNSAQRGRVGSSTRRASGSRRPRNAAAGYWIRRVRRSNLLGPRRRTKAARAAASLRVSPSWGDCRSRVAGCRATCWSENVALATGRERSMNTEVRDRESLQRRLKQLYAPVAAEMVEAEQVLTRELRSDYPYVDQMVRHAQHLGGKRLRPALVLLAAKACGNVTSRPLRAGRRRGNDPHRHAGPRRRARRGRSPPAPATPSTPAGATRPACCWATICSRTPSTWPARWKRRSPASTIGRATNIVCEGELRQIDSRGNFSLSRSRVPVDHRGQDGRTVRLLLPAGRPLRRRRAGRDVQLRTASAAIWGSPFRSPTICSICWATNEPTANRWAPIWRSRR